MSASLGKMVGASVRFEKCLDVPFAGILCALPALLVNGLLNGAKKFLGGLKGCYTIFQVLRLSALTALCRIKSAENENPFSFISEGL